MKKFAPYTKAIVGSLVAGLGSLSVALTDGSVSPAEWVATATAALVALGGVYAFPNAAAPVAADDGEV